MLPHILDTVLPSLLPRILTATSPTPSSQHSIASQLSQAAAAPQLSALGISLHDRLASTLESEISAIYTHTLSHANWLRSKADDEFTDMLEDERLALERVAEENFQDFKERCDGVEEDVIERLGWRAEEVCDNAMTSFRDGLERNKNGRINLEQEKEALKRDMAELREDKGELRKDKEQLRKDKEELTRDKEDLRNERANLRMDQKTFWSEKEALKVQREALHADRRRFVAEQIKITQSATTQGKAGSAPV